MLKGPALTDLPMRRTISHCKTNRRFAPRGLDTVTDFGPVCLRCPPSKNLVALGCGDYWEQVCLPT